MKGLLDLKQAARKQEGIYNGDFRDLIEILPDKSVDLLILDPPYNLSKEFNGKRFSRMSVEKYSDWLAEIISSLMGCLKDHASVYICGDWFSSASIFLAASKCLTVRNRITWEREKGRGAKSNWKNSSEDIWFCTRGSEYTFNLDAVKLRRKVIAPYRDKSGNPKDWDDTADGAWRDTHPSNFWSDITVPFWSMPENTQHPTQKSEKLIAKLLLASSNPGDLVLDPFAGSGTTAVVAEKLGRRCLASETDLEYCCFALKRLQQTRSDQRIQGYADGVFFERNSHTESSRNRQSKITD